MCGAASLPCAGFACADGGWRKGSWIVLGAVCICGNGMRRPDRLCASEVNGCARGGKGWEELLGVKTAVARAWVSRGRASTRELRLVSSIPGSFPMGSGHFPRMPPDGVLGYRM